MPLPYRNVKDMYDVLHDAGVVTTTLPEWSAEQNRLGNTDLYTAGLHDNFIKRSSVAIDRALEATGIPKVTEQFGRGVGEAVGAPDVGAKIGAGIPRSVVNLASFAIPGPGWIAGAARLGIAGLLSGAETYTETGSPAAGVLAGGTFAALPGAIAPVERAVLAKTGSRFLAGTAGQAAAATGIEASRFGQDVITGQPLHNPASVETLLNLTLGQAPFAALHLGGKLIRGEGSVEQHAVDSASKVAQPPPEPRVFPPATSEQLRETGLRLAQLRGEQVSLDPTNVDEANNLLQQEHEVLKQHVPTANSVFGDSIQQDTPRQQVIGHELKSTGKWRAVLVSDAPVNPEELRGKVVTYSTAYEPNPVARSTGDTVFGLPDPQWRTLKTQDEWNARGKPIGPSNQPDLPVQAVPATDEQMFAHIQDLKKVEIDVDTAQTPADLQKAVVRLQGVQHENDILPTNDATLRPLIERLIKAGVDPKVVTQTAVKVEANRTARKIQSTREAERGVAPLTPEKAAKVSAQMGGTTEGNKGFQIITADKLSHSVEDISKLPADTSEPLKNVVEEGAYIVTDPEVKSKPDDVRLFRTMVSELGSLTDASPSDLADVAQFISDRDGTPLPDVKDEIKNFMAQPYAQEWNQRLEQYVAKVREENSAPGPVRPPPGERLVTVQKADGTTFQASFGDKYYEGGRASVARLTPEGKWSHTVLGEGDKIVEPHKAGVGWLFSLAPYDPVRNLLGGKHTLPKSGEVQESVFRNIGGTQGKPLTSTELDLYRAIVPEAFTGDVVNVPKLVSGLQEKGPVVEVRKLGGVSTGTNRSEQLQHELETSGYAPIYDDNGQITHVQTPNGRRYTFGDWATIPQNRVSQLVELQSLGQQNHPDYTRGVDVQQGEPRYSFLGPKPESNMPGYVEGLVRLPNEELKKHLATVSDQDTSHPDYSDEDVAHFDKSIGVKYRGPHFGSGDTNVLSFFRGYEENLPDGTKAFHVIEVQSDWGRRIREELEARKRGETSGTDAWNATHRPTADHPLLRVYESLALKAAIQHAKEIGATKVILSDAETAMMTEGHDIVTQETLGTGPERGVIPQEPGMRLHYDQTLPKAMEKLTGEKGVGVELGEHKMSRQSFSDELFSNEVGSPIFRDASGAPKTQITGRAYDISHLPSDFTLTEANRAPSFEPFIPDNPQDVATVESLGLDRGGQGLHDFLRNETNPVIRALYEGLKPYTDTMKNIEVVVGETKSGNSATFDLGGGKTRIVISPSTLDSPVKGFTVAHELVHGLTLSELNNPTKANLVAQFDEMRQRLIDTLPKREQDQLAFLERTDWRTQYSQGNASYESILPGGTAFDRQKLYGLLNTKEMVAQGLASRQMQAFMRSVKAGKGTWFSRFTDTVKNLLGLKVDGTFFDEFLTKTNQLLEHGNYVSSFRDFSNRYFENLGLTGSLVQGQTRRALGIVLDSGFGTSREDIIGRLGNDVSVRAPEVTTTKRDLNVALQGEAKPEYEQFMGELGFEPSVKGFDDFVHEALNGRVANHQDALDMMPTEASRYVFAKVKDMQNMLGVLRAATAEANKGLINLADPVALRGPIKDALKAVDRIAQVQKVHELGSQLINESMALQPDVFADRMESAPDVKTLEDFGNEDPKKKLGGLSYFLGQAARIARRFPVTAELIDRGYELGANTATMKGNVLKVLGLDLSKPEQGITKEGLATSVKAISSTRTLNAVNRWMYWSNKAALDEQRGVTMLPDSHPEVAKLLAPLTEKERNDVIDTVTKRSVSNQVLQAETLEKMHQIGVALGAHITMKDGNVKTADAMQITGQLFDALRADRTNPSLAQQADAQIALVQSKMSPEGFLELVKSMQSTLEQFKGWEEYFKKNPDWSTAQRLERFLVSFTRGKQKKQLQASSVKEANILAEGGKNVEIVDQWKGREDEFPTLGPDAQGLFQRMSELEQNQLRSLQSKGYLDEQGLTDFQRMSIKTQLARETAGQQPGVPKFQVPPRLLSQGAEELPWFWNHIAHAERTSNYWSRKLFRMQASLHLGDPDMVANPTLQAWAKQHVENMLQPDPSFTQKVARFTSTWFMGFAPASAMMNGFQTISTAVPEMTLENGGRMIDAYGKWGRAVAEVSKESLPRGEWSTDDHKWLSKQMSEAHEWDFSMYSDEAYTQEAASTNFRRVMLKQKPQTVGQRLGTLAGNYSVWGMAMFKSVERFNNKVASVMAFDHYRAEGMSREEALVEAKRFNRAVNYSGGRANRPVGVFSGSSDFARSTAMLATNMQGYNLGVVGQIADYLQRGFFRPAGITPAEVYSARKAGLQMLGTQMVAAGALGLPFVSGTVALLNQFFPGLEINRHIREWAKAFFDGDKENGGTLGDIALTGLPSMVGWDMQSRLSIGNVVPGTSEYNGFQPETLLGPPVNMITSWINGAKRVAMGDPKGGEAFVPPGVKKLFQLALEDGKLKDYRERPLFTPTVGETAGIALGFNPKRLSDFNAASRIETQNQDVVRRREGQFHQQQAEEVLKGNFGSVRQTLLSRSSQDKTFDPQSGVRSIAQAAEDLTFPRDLHREGTLGTSTQRSRLLSTFNLPSSQVSEVDRANFRLQIEQRLGLRVDPRRELRVAQMVDELQRQNPTATRSELRRKVAGMLRTTPQNESLLPVAP